MRICAPAVPLVLRRTSPVEAEAGRACARLRFPLPSELLPSSTAGSAGGGESATRPPTAAAASLPDAGRIARSKAPPSATGNAAGRLSAADGRTEARRSHDRCHDRACKHVSAHHANSCTRNSTPAGVTSRPPSRTVQPSNPVAGSSPPRRMRRSLTADHGTRLRPQSQCRIVRRHTPSSWAHAGWLKARLRRSSRNPSGDRCQTRRRRPGFGVPFGAQCLLCKIISR